jgi:RNA methyltransferase, TrmH family
MLSKNNVKYIRSLKLKKFRQKYNNFVVEGDKIAQEMLRQNKFEIEKIFALSQWIETTGALLEFHENKLVPVSEKELKKISFLKSPNEVLIVAKKKLKDFNAAEVKEGISLFLDGIRDPGNMGTIVRIADWFGVKTVFCSPNNVSLYNAKVLQATMGAFLRVKVVEIPFSKLISNFPDLPVYGTVLGGENIFTSKLESRGIIVIGSEAQGISKEVLKQIDHKITIPPSSTNGAESLNAAVATGIVCAIFKNNIKQ